MGIRARGPPHRVRGRHARRVLGRAPLHGAPTTLYLDNGSTCRGDALRVCCERLDIALFHAKPYDAPARGKMERFWRTLRAAVLDHLGGLTSLHDVQVRLNAFLDEHYHHAPHGWLLGGAPADAWASRPAAPSTNPSSRSRSRSSAAAASARTERSISTAASSPSSPRTPASPATRSRATTATPTRCAPPIRSPRHARAGGDAAKRRHRNRSRSIRPARSSIAAPVVAHARPRQPRDGHPRESASRHPCPRCPTARRHTAVTTSWPG